MVIRLTKQKKENLTKLVKHSKVKRERGKYSKGEEKLKYAPIYTKIIAEVVWGFNTPKKMQELREKVPSLFATCTFNANIPYLIEKGIITRKNIGHNKKPIWEYDIKWAIFNEIIKETLIEDLNNTENRINELKKSYEKNYFLLKKLKGDFTILEDEEQDYNNWIKNTEKTLENLNSFKKKIDLFFKDLEDKMIFVFIRSAIKKQLQSHLFSSEDISLIEFIRQMLIEWHRAGGIGLPYTEEPHEKESLNEFSILLSSYFDFCIYNHLRGDK
jgi:hypothetical protein